MSRSLSLGIALLGLACAAPEREKPPPDLSVVRAQIDSVWTKYSAAAVGGDANALTQLYADNAYVVESGLPTVRGNVELRSVVKAVLGGVRLRARNLDLLRSWRLTDAQLDLPGAHPGLGRVTLRQLLAAWVVHDLGHIAQVARVMAKQYQEEIGPWAPFLPVVTDRPTPSS